MKSSKPADKKKLNKALKKPTAVNKRIAIDIVSGKELVFVYFDPEKVLININFFCQLE
jgi:hypothetical protein